VARLLLARGADPKAKDAEGMTALHTAAAGGDVGLVEALLDGKADVNARGEKGTTPLSAAIRISSSTTTYKIGDKETTTKRVWLSPRSVGMVSLLLARGAKVNDADDSGSTALHRAALADDVNLVRLLLSRKADPKIRDDDGRTALDISVAEKNERVAALLRRFTPKK
jgi:ankyrin repeat protein